MNKAETTIRRAFADAEELTIELDKEGIVRIKGKVVVDGITFTVTIHRNDSGNTQLLSKESSTKYKQLYTGTISTLDPSSTSVMLSETLRRNKEKKGIPFLPKDIYATKKYSCDSSDPQKIVDAILQTISALIKQDKSQLDEAILKSITPDQLSLDFACNHYAADFLRRAYPNAPPENNAKRLAQLNRTLTKFPATPIAKLSKRRVNTILKEIRATDDAVNLCFLFVEYLLQMRKCSGNNPFSKPSARVPRDKNALTQQELGDAVFKKFFELLSQKAPPMIVIIALAASGFPFTDIAALVWGDLEFIAGYKDFLVVHIQRAYAAVSKHDFSRPAISDSALLICEVYQELKKHTPMETLAEQRIWPDNLDSKAVNNEIRNLLVRAGFNGRFSTTGRPRENDVEIPSRILQTNYKRMLYSKAGLRDDPDTYNFLCGTLYKSSTFTSYESHTDVESMLRLYQFLMPLSIEKKLNKHSGYRSGKEATVYDTWPKTTHEVAHTTGQIHLKPGEKLTLLSAHGCTGIARIFRESSGED